MNDNQKIEIVSRLHHRISSKDWYTKAILAWGKLQNREISVNDFPDDYGIAAGDDYELTKPRYYELLKRPKPIIKNVKLENMKVKNLEDLYAGMQYLRSEAKKKNLVWISALRNLLIKN